MADRLESLVADSLYLIRVLSGKNPAVSFSGGKDSLVALDLAIRTGIGKAVFSDTTIEFDSTLKYVETIRSFYGIELDIVRPPKTFLELVDVFGFPSRRLRWCCDALKFGPLGRYALAHQLTSFITGLRSDESRKRRNYSYLGRNPLLPIRQVNPLLDWTETDIWDYIEEFSLPINPLYKIGLKRIGCWPCPFKTQSDWEITKKYFPNLVDQLKSKLLRVVGKFDTGIKNVVDFVEKRAWVRHAYTQTSRIKGEMSYINGASKISMIDKADVHKTLKLLPLATHDYYVDEREIILRKIDNLRRLKTLVEKAINCIGCGACVVTCKNEALYLDHGTLSVNSERCDMCGQCLTSKGLRRACLRRNYAPMRYEIRSSVQDQKNDKEIEETFSNLCDGSLSVVGLIRSRTSLSKVEEFTRTLGKVSKMGGGTLIVRNSVFTAVLSESQGLTEVRFRTQSNDLKRSIKAIRNVLQKAKEHQNRYGL